MRDLRTIEECSLWLEMGWWTSEEALLALMDIHPYKAKDRYFNMRVTETEIGMRISDLIYRAIEDNQISDLKYERNYIRAPCKSWILWAKNKKSFSINPNLIQALILLETDSTTSSSEDKNSKILYTQHLYPKVFEHAKKYLLERNFSHAVSESAKAFDKAVRDFL